ncbi:MAG TPA: M20/M25/M40 family metallo-hydrolase [Rhodothermales bacterium]|nr:M20/M25/M40 family metallo-hydrolase [Rhodothermales bacterium]
MRRFSALALLVVLAPAVQAQAVDTAAVSFLRAETGDRGMVMEHARRVTDVNGPRLTGSPALDRAERWAVEQFQAWGLEAELEAWGPFGRGWSVERSSLTAHVEGDDVTEHNLPLIAISKAWSPDASARGAEVVLFDAQTDADFERYRGRLRGRVVLSSPIAEIDLGMEALAHRHDAQALLEMANRPMPEAGNSGRSYPPAALERYRFAQRRLAFLLEEGTVAILEPSNTTDDGALRVMAAQVPAPEANGSPLDRPQPWQAGRTTAAQFVVLPVHYNRLVRLLEAGERVTMDVDLAVDWHDGSDMEANVIAEIPGTDPALRDEVVMIGAHLDSWHSGTGATDNAAGVAVVMEAARALQTMYRNRGEGPRRTIRFGLWTGEEQGLFGSRAYVNGRYATVPGYGQPPTALGPEHERLSAYFNLDNGSGRIRGIYAQGNTEAAAIFRPWLTAIDDSTAQTITVANTGGTDHLSFDAAGLPGFQFIQDPLAYGAQTWHTHLDTFDHLSEPDLEQAAGVMAVFAHLAAQRDERFPRKPLQMAEPTGTR